MPTLHPTVTMRTRPEPPPAGREAALAIGFLALLTAGLLAAVALIWAATTFLLWAGVTG